MAKYLKIAPDPDAKPCRCGDGNPDCEHFEFCPECGEEYKAHEGHDCLDGFAVAQVGTAKELLDAAKELRDALDACETERDRLRSELDAAHDGEDALRSEVSRLRAQIAALQSVPQGVEVPELTADVVEELHQKSKGHRNPGYALAFEMYRWVKAHARLVPTPPQDATGAQITFSQPETSPYLICDHCGGEMALTDGWVPTYSNPDNQGCNPSAEPYCPKCDAPHPLQPEERRMGPDEVAVSMDEWEALNAFLEDWRAPESRSLHDWNTSLKAKAARINALRTSAQDHNGEGANNVG